MRRVRAAGLGLVLAAACAPAHETRGARADEAAGPAGAPDGGTVDRAEAPGTRGEYTSGTPSGSAATQEGTAGLVTSGTGEFGTPSPAAPATGTDRKPAAGIEPGSTRVAGDDAGVPAPDAGAR